MADFMSRFSPATRERLETYRQKYSHVIAKAREVSDTVTETIEVAGTAFGFAWAEGRYGEDKTTFFGDKDASGAPVAGTGVPASLLVGLAGHIVIFSGMDGGYAKHIRNISDGALAHYAVKAGLKLGQKMADDAAAAGGPGCDDTEPMAPDAPTSDEAAAHRRVMDIMRGHKAA